MGDEEEKSPMLGMAGCRGLGSELEAALLKKPVGSGNGGGEV